MLLRISFCGSERGFFDTSFRKIWSEMSLEIEHKKGYLGHFRKVFSCF